MGGPGFSRFANGSGRLDPERVQRALALLAAYCSTLEAGKRRSKVQARAWERPWRPSEAAEAAADEWEAEKLCEWEAAGRLTEGGDLRLVGARSRILRLRRWFPECDVRWVRRVLNGALRFSDEKP